MTMCRQPRLNPPADPRPRRFRPGVAMAEMIVGMMTAAILVVAVGGLLDGGNRAWLRTYASAHGRTNREAQALVAAFGSLGRKANRGNYVLYEIDNGSLEPVVPNPAQSEAVVFGDAAEFRYWDVPLDLTDSHGLMDASKTATAYALFYLDGDQLKVDYGPYPPGAAPPGRGKRNTTEVSFVNGETIDMPIHINQTDDSPDTRDISISGSPKFLQPVAMGESRYTQGGSDKYSGVMSLFDGGIYFSQPASRVTDESSVQSKVSRFRDSTLAQYRFTPATSTTAFSPRHPAVQLEFFVDGGVGKVRITNNCTVRGYQQNSDAKTYDFRIKPGTGGTQYERYDIYEYHVRHNNTATTTIPLTNTYVTQSFGGVDSEPGGQIYVDGNIVIGGDDTKHNNDQVVKGRVTVIATGNIWVADNIYVDGAHDAAGKPTDDNPNVLGLLAQGVIKVVDPGRCTGVTAPNKHVYLQVCRPDGSDARKLTNPTVIEAAITVGGGGWGAENVKLGSYGGRKPLNSQYYLEVHGTISEAIRGVVGSGSGWSGNGYLKSYRMDRRLLTGIVPGDIWMRGKYVPAPAGWHDYRAGN